MPVDLRDPAILLERIDGADRDLRFWYLLLVTWRVIGFELDEASMAPFEAQGKRWEELREKVAQVRKRERASDHLFQDVMDEMETQHEIEGVLWELASRFAAEHGLMGRGWGLPPEWR